MIKKKYAGTRRRLGTIFSQELPSFSWDKRRKSEDTDCIIINTVKEEMDIEMFPNDLDRSHRIRNPKTKKKKRPIIVKFARYNLSHIFKNKKTVKKVCQLWKASQNTVWQH